MLANILSPIAGLALSAIGVSMLGTVLALDLRSTGSSPFMVGLLFSAFYGGYVLGAFKLEGYIKRVGSIRAFSTFAASMAAITLLHGLIREPFVWVLLRFVYGLCNAATFIVIESWLLSLSSVNNRGQVLAIYMLSLYAAHTFGQYLIGFMGGDLLLPYMIVGILSASALIPISSTRARTPEYSDSKVLGIGALYKISPSAFWGCLFSGFILSGVYGLLPVTIHDYGFTKKEISLLMAAVMLGGTLLQMPLGKLSDVINRRIVLISLYLLTIAVTFGLIYAVQANFFLFACLLFLFGGITFALYPISINSACDHVDPSQLVSATAGLLVFYSIGCVFGTLVAPAISDVMQTNDGLFYYFIATGVLAVVSILVASRKRSLLSSSEQEAFAPVTRTTPIAMELDPRSED